MDHNSFHSLRAARYAPSCPSITIAGRGWPVPLLAPRQNRIIVPLLMKGSSGYAVLLEIAFAALTRAHPHLRREEVDDWPIPFHELCDALPVIARQTGMLRRTSANAADPTPPDWDAIIAQFVNFLPGTTPDYWEDALTWPRLEAMQAEWRRHPPVSALVAAYLGYRPKPRDLDAIGELMKLFPTGQLRLN